MILLIAAAVAAGFFLRKSPYKYPYSWSQTSPEAMTFEDAIAFCDKLEESGCNDWRLPELHEIKSIDELCVEEENSDFCAVTDSCEWDSCKTELCGKCEKYKENFDSGSFWTRTPLHGEKVSVFSIEPEKTETIAASKNEKHYAKCVRVK